MRLSLSSPCPLAQGQIPAKDGYRWHCGVCDKHVYDLSEMGPERAAVLLREKGQADGFCAEWREDRHGNVVFHATRAAAAAAAMVLAGPAFADGGDVPVIDAIALIEARNAEENRALDSADGQQVDSHADEAASPPPPPMYRGRIHTVALQPAPAPTSSTP